MRALSSVAGCLLAGCLLLAESPVQDETSGADLTCEGHYEPVGGECPTSCEWDSDCAGDYNCIGGRCLAPCDDDLCAPYTCDGVGRECRDRCYIEDDCARGYYCCDVFDDWCETGSCV